MEGGLSDDEIASWDVVGEGGVELAREAVRDTLGEGDAASLRWAFSAASSLTTTDDEEEVDWSESSVLIDPIEGEVSAVKERKASYNGGLVVIL